MRKQLFFYYREEEEGERRRGKEEEEEEEKERRGGKGGRRGERGTGRGEEKKNIQVFSFFLYYKLALVQNCLFFVFIYLNIVFSRYFSIHSLFSLQGGKKRKREEEEEEEEEQEEERRGEEERGEVRKMNNVFPFVSLL